MTSATGTPAPVPAATFDWGCVAPATRKVARAMALLWSYRPRAAIQQLLTALDITRDDGRQFTADGVRDAIVELRARGLIAELARREGYLRLADRVRGTLYGEVLDLFPLATLRAALHRIDAFRPDHLAYYWPLHDIAATIAHVRLELFGGTPARDLRRLQASIQRSLDWNEVFRAAVYPAFSAKLFERVDAEWQWELAFAAATDAAQAWYADAVPLAEWAIEAIDRGRDVPEPLRLAVADVLLQRGDREHMRRHLAFSTGASADALRAAALVQEGRWVEGQQAFEAATKLRQAETRLRKGLFPDSVIWYYPVALLAEGTPRELDLAYRYCLQASGKRTPDPRSGWGRWVRAVGSRLGEATLETAAFDLAAGPAGYVSLDDLWHFLLAAWLGRSTIAPAASAVDANRAVVRFATALKVALERCGFTALLEQVEAAEASLLGRDHRAISFLRSGGRESWRDVLAALRTLASPAEPEDVDATRLVWALEVRPDGRLDAIVPYEQKRGARGWGKAKLVPLAKIAGNTRLPPWDAKVARALRRHPHIARRWDIDRAAAILALVGHPAVALAHAPDELIELVAGTPALEVERHADRYVLRINPPLRAEEPRAWHDASPAGDRDAEALRAITLVAESAQRMRVVRLTAAQRRAALLVGAALEIPEEARADLESTLQTLAGHFSVHSDVVTEAQEVEAEARLRAELSPAGANLRLRVVVAPLGSEGPRLAPGSGRARLMAALGGRTLATTRDLERERRHLAALLEALPQLEPLEESVNGCERLLEDPDEALAVVEALPNITAVAAIDWPKGKSVRVHTVDTAQLSVAVRSERQWFRVTGQAAVDERLVLDMATLLGAARSRSRFVPMGDGLYAALTGSLRQRLQELATVAEASAEGLRVPRLAAGWLGEIVAGTAVEDDEAFRAALLALDRMQQERVSVPRSLLAELRPYQVEGYVWAMRLAQAGLGACLADDMGLGKTLQGLAVLLARSAGGAALVIAPTSVCANWRLEARRFAPTLNVVLYGEGEREAVVANAGPRDVIVVSYTLLQLAAERFAARGWHTVIADEAQAIKNASAKRSLAAFELDADFRMALSGTPVENRLAELWSIMRFVNPGLLGSQARFTERFALPIERDRDRPAQHALKRLIRPFVLRRTKAQVLDDLPPRTELDLAVVPDAEERAFYEALRRQAQTEAERAMALAPAGEAGLNVLAQLTRLRRAACDPRLVSARYGMPGAKVAAFAELAAELVANGHKALVFSQFVDFLALLREPLDAAGITYQYLDGATPAPQRAARVAAFQAGEGDLFLISLKAGGYGLNLTAADYVLITDPWWNPAAEDQAMGRAHRLGQDRPVTVYRLVTQGSIEQRIVLLHHDKRALADGILADGEGAALPRAAELLALLRGDDGTGEGVASGEP